MARSRHNKRMPLLPVTPASHHCGEAVAEFHKVIDYPGIVVNEPSVHYLISHGRPTCFSQGIFLQLFQLYPVKGATNEQDYFMANESPDRRSKIHPASETHGRRSVFLGRAVEICVYEPRSWPFHKTGDPVSTLHGDLHRGP